MTIKALRGWLDAGRKLLVVAAIATTGVAWGATETVDDVIWTYTVSDGEASVGGGSWSSPAVPRTTTGVITIPSTLGECPVTSIGKWAFDWCLGLESVTIPSSVTSIGEYAFCDCSGLTSVTIPSSVTNIGGSAFSYCSGLTSVKIPSSVTSIGEYAFCGCGGLTSVTIPSSVTNIGEYAFYDCSGLTSVTIPSGVTSIGENVFAYCSGLTAIQVDADNAYYKSVNGLLLTKNGATLIVGVGGDVTIPSSVTSIGPWAFCGCFGLESVTIPEGVTSIGEYAFRGCGGLESVTIPSSVTSIGEGVFAYCSELTTIQVDADSAYYKSVNGLLLTKDGSMLIAVVDGDVTIPSSVTSIGEGAFSCSGLESVTIPSSVTNIGAYAFESCDELTSVTISEGVTSIGEGAFSYSGLESVTIPSSVTNIGAYAFESCDELASVTMSEGVTSIGEYAFYDCNGLTSVTIPSSVTNIGAYAFYGCDALNTVYVDGDVERVKALILASGSDLDMAALTFVEPWEESLSISPDRLPDGLVGADYAAELNVEGGTAPYSWQVRDNRVVGVKYAESREPGTCTKSGTAQDWQDDDCCWAYALPFEFPFYGKRYKTAYVNSNGTLSFDGWFDEYSASMSGLKDNVMIAVMWDDHDTTSGDVYVTEAEDAVTFRWCGERCSDDSPVNFAATLYADGRIRLSYGSGNTSGGLVGISAGDGENFLVSECSQKGSLANARDVVFGPAAGDVHYGLPDGITLSEGGVLSGVATEASSNLVDVVVTDAQGKRNHKEIVLCILKPDGVYTNVVGGVEWHYIVSNGLATLGVSATEGAVSRSTSGELTIPTVLGGSPVVGIGAHAFSECGELESVDVPAGVTGIGANAFTGCSNLRCLVLRSVNVGVASDAFGDDAEFVAGLRIDFQADDAFFDGWRLSGTQETYPFDGNGVFLVGSGDVAFPVLKTVECGVGKVSTFRMPESAGGGTAVLAGIANVNWGDFAECPYEGNGGGEVDSCWCLTYSDIVDVEKTAAADEDDDECYAMRRINLAYWGGWIPRDVYPSVDDVAEEFRENGFLNAFYWVNAHCEDFGLESGEIYSNYDLAYCEGKQATFDRFVVNHLKNGNSILEMSWEDYHGITCCGYVCDDSKQPGDEGFLKGLFIVDSDNDVYSGEGGSAAPNRVTYCPVRAVYSEDAFECYAIANVWGCEEGYLSGDLGALWARGKKESLPFSLIVENAVVTGFEGDVPEHIAISEDVTSIGAYAFESCDELVSVTISEGVANIGEGAFSCSGLESVTIPSSVTNIGACAFELCLELTSVTISEGVAGIGEYAFYHCIGLESVTIPSSVTSIRGCAFACSGLKSVTIPSSVTSIGMNAFRECNRLTNVVFSGNAPAVGSNPFYGVPSGCTATVYEGTTGWDDDGDGEWEGLTLVWIGRDPIPDLGENPTKEQVSEALGGSADSKLVACITNGTQYAAFRAWVATVTNANGTAVGAQAVKDAPKAWLSFALGCETLIAKEPEDGDVEVEAFEPAADGSFEFTVSVKDIAVGKDATSENLQRVFGVVGGTSPEELTPGGVDIEFGTPENGRVKFTAKPKSEGLPTYFMRVNMAK